MNRFNLYLYFNLYYLDSGFPSFSLPPSITEGEKSYRSDRDSSNKCPDGIGGTGFVCFKNSAKIQPAVGEFVVLGQRFPRICIQTVDVTLLKQKRRRKFLKSKFRYHPNTHASFNIEENLGPTIQDQASNSTTFEKPINRIRRNPNSVYSDSELHNIPVRITNRIGLHNYRGYCARRQACSSNLVSISPATQQKLTNTEPVTHGGQNKRISIIHLNAQSLKNRAHFSEVKELAHAHDFDIFAVSETWFDTTVTNASVHIEGYNIYRLDRLKKSGGGVCAYIKSNLKTKVLKDLSVKSPSGLHQSWLQIQHKNTKSLIICIVYRQPDIPTSC